ncbi:MAG: glycosyltransferase, partial [Candidatus Hodarchaeota archaeon]
SLACETPVVVTEYCGAVECVDETCAVIVKRKDPKAIADAIMEILPNREEMGKAGRKRLIEQFSSESLANKTISIFEDVLNGK